MSRKVMRIGLIVGILVAAVIVSVLLTLTRKEPPKKPVENLAMLVEAYRVMDRAGDALPELEIIGGGSANDSIETGAHDLL